MSGNLTLGDLGERRILREIIPKYASGVGDDCASLQGLHEHVVVTTDPVPPPASLLLGKDEDLYWMGWLLVTINASDVAASGARPNAFIAALEMPSNLPLCTFERMLKGIRDSCAANGFAYVGGNLREAAKIGGVGTAIGSSPILPLSRKGAKVGDHLLLIGEGGRFWSDVCRIKRGETVEKYSSPVYSPVSQSRHVYRLHESGLITCAMDTSDGLAPTLEELALANRLAIEIDLAPMISSQSDHTSRPERLWFGWGDWTVVAVVAESRLPAAKEALALLGVASTTIGKFTMGDVRVTLRKGRNTRSLARLESERFAADSWFSQGIDEYRRLLDNFPLPE